MRRLVFISDVHSNLPALEAVIGHAGEGEIICLGDIVGYGAEPNEVVERLEDLDTKAVLGNHDRAALTGDARGFNAQAALAASWTSKNLNQRSKQYLAALPQQLKLEWEDETLYLTHGSPDDPLNEYVDPRTHSDLFDFYLDRTGSTLMALGHTHVPYVWKSDRGIVFNPGSVGQPRDGDPRAAYAVVTIERASPKVEHHRVKYDSLEAGSRILGAGLPRSLADRLLVGY